MRWAGAGVIATVFTVLSVLCSFSVPDTSAWHWRLVVSASGPLEIPGEEDFPRPDAKFMEIETPRSSAGGGGFQFSAHTPEWKRWTGHAGVWMGERTQTWQGVVVDGWSILMPVGGDGAKRTALMEATLDVVEVSVGAEYHPWKRHFFGLEVAMPVWQSLGELTYEIEDEKIHSGKMPASFREAMMPRLMATYDYRLFDRVDLGFGVSILHGDYYAKTPEADIESLGTIRLENGSTGSWFEIHIGWTFGRAAP